MEAMGMLRNDFAVLIDVRNDDQQKDGIAQGALLMPSSKIEADGPDWKEFLSRIPKEKRLIVYGANPADSAKAAEQLAAKGFDVGNIGTFDDWTKAGLPTQKR
jgi:rhodanese-related sulfurtransferase